MYWLILEDNLLNFKVGPFLQSNLLVLPQKLKSRVILILIYKLFEICSKNLSY